jgi:conjugative transfer region protein TrbK
VDGKTLARLGAIVFVSFAVTMTAIEWAGRDDAPGEEGRIAPLIAPYDPLPAELHRCSALGEAGGRDPECLRAWAESRRRFLGAGVRPTERLPEPIDGPDAGLPLPADPAASVDKAPGRPCALSDKLPPGPAPDDAPLGSVPEGCL